MGCVFLFTAGSLSFFHVGIVFSFSLRSACSSKIGLMKKEAIFFKRQSVYIFKTNSFDHEEDRFVHIFETHFVDSVIFAAVGFFSSSGFCISFPCFPAFFHCGRTASVGLWAAIRTKDTPAKRSPTRVLVVPEEGIRPYGGRTKADALHHFQPITVQRFELPHFPAYVLPNMVSHRKTVALPFWSPWLTKKTMWAFISLFAFFKSAAGIFN